MTATSAGNTANWANRLTLSRLAAAPLLLAAAAAGAPRAFVGVAVYGVLSDVLDGPIARVTQLDSARGARLDSRADFAFYPALFLGLGVLEPHRLFTEWKTMAVIALAYFVPILFGWFKFRVVTAYHTVLARSALPLLMLGGILWVRLGVTWPIRLAAIVLVVSAFEEMAITWLLDEPRHNVPHFARVLHARARYALDTRVPSPSNSQPSP